MSENQPLSPRVLELPDPERTAAELAEAISEEVRELRRRGAVVALSGGVDSTVTAALCVRALGRERVLGVLMPERDSSEDTQALSVLAAESLGIDRVTEDITPILDAAGCYRRRDEAIRRLIPEYGEGWRAKLVLPSVVETESYRIFSIVVQSPEGRERRERLPPAEYLQVVAATNFKQRTRKMVEYYHADRLQYAVMGTPNRLEYDQGFFVKNGDGAADIKPIAHLYKTQVYQLAEAMGIPDEIRSRPPTTDTYSMAQSQEEFFFSLPYAAMDLCLYAVNAGVPATEVAAALDLTPEQVERVFGDIVSKRRAGRYLHAPPRLLGELERSTRE